MRKIAMALCAFAVCSAALWSEETAAAGNAAVKDDYAVVVSGDANLVLKKQDSYRTPFDIPEWGWDQRAGASDRDTQWYRIKANINLSTGTPGVTEWFGDVSLNADLNSPDQNETTYGLEGGTLVATNNNTEIKKVELSNALVMWRPEMLGGRPLGITAGVTSIAQTANAAYSSMFSGDLDNDYIGYTISALTTKPMVNIDFHVKNDTGVGVALVRGASDFIQNSAAFDDKTSFTGVAWAEAGWKGIGFNAAYQYARGNRAESETESIDSLHGSSIDYSSLKWDPKFWASSVNAMLSYDYRNGNIGAKPFVGYNLQFGQEASAVELQSSDNDYATKSTFVQVFTGGAILSAKLGTVPVRLSGEYSKIMIPGFNGLDGLEDGNIEGSVFAINSGLRGMESLNGLPAGTFGSATEGVFKGLCGSSKTVYTFGGLDGQYHLELAADVSPKVTLALFMNGTNVKSVDVTVTDEQKAKMADRLKSAGICAALGAGQDAAVAQIVDGVASEIEKTDDFGTRWTDSMSYGFAVTYKY